MHGQVNLHAERQNGTKKEPIAIVAVKRERTDRSWRVKRRYFLFPRKLKKERRRYFPHGNATLQLAKEPQHAQSGLNFFFLFFSVPTRGGRRKERAGVASPAAMGTDHPTRATGAKAPNATQLGHPCAARRALVAVQVRRAGRPRIGQLPFHFSWGTAFRLTRGEWWRERLRQGGRADRGVPSEEDTRKVIKVREEEEEAIYIHTCSAVSGKERARDDRGRARPYPKQTSQAHYYLLDEGEGSSSCFFFPTCGAKRLHLHRSAPRPPLLCLPGFHPWGARRPSSSARGTRTPPCSRPTPPVRTDQIPFSILPPPSCSSWLG
jgi:hypothetical protein